MFADYVDMLKIKWPWFLSKIAKIRAALLKLLAEMIEWLHLILPSLYISPVYTLYTVYTVSKKSM